MISLFTQKITYSNENLSTKDINNFLANTMKAQKQAEQSGCENAKIVTVENKSRTVHYTGQKIIIENIITKNCLIKWIDYFNKNKNQSIIGHIAKNNRAFQEYVQDLKREEKKKVKQVITKKIMQQQGLCDENEVTKKDIKNFKKNNQEWITENITMQDPYIPENINNFQKDLKEPIIDAFINNNSLIEWLKDVEEDKKKIIIEDIIEQNSCDLLSRIKIKIEFFHRITQHVSGGIDRQELFIHFPNKYFQISEILLFELDCKETSDYNNKYYIEDEINKKKYFLKLIKKAHIENYHQKNHANRLHSVLLPVYFQDKENILVFKWYLEHNDMKYLLCINKMPYVVWEKSGNVSILQDFILKEDSSILEEQPSEKLEQLIDQQQQGQQKAEGVEKSRTRRKKNKNNKQQDQQQTSIYKKLSIVLIVIIILLLLMLIYVIYINYYKKPQDIIEENYMNNINDNNTNDNDNIISND